MKVTTLKQLENGIERVATKLNQYATKTELAGKLDSTGKAETAGTADNAIRDGEGNVISSTYLKKSDNVGVDLSDYQTAAQADAKYLGKNDTATNSEKATKDGQDRNIADTYLTKSEASSTYLAKSALNVISTIPSQSGSVNYDGTAKTPSWLNYDPLKLQISGDYQNKTNAGTYQTGFKPISPYTWTNGSQTVQTANWTIGKAAGRLSLSAESGSVNIDATSTFTVDREGDGAVTATSANSSCVTVSSTTTGTVTVKCTNYSAAATQITINVAETTKYTSGTTTCTVTTAKATPTLTLSAESVVLTSSNPTATVTVTTNSTGALSATPNNAYSCSATVNDNTVSIKALSHDTAFVTVTVAETNNFLAISKNVSVDTRNAPVNILEGRTLAQLQAIIKNGEALNYFQVGDYFDITFTTDVFIMQNGAYDSNNSYIESYDFKIPANSTWRAVCIGINHNSSIEGVNRFHFAIIKNTQNQNLAFIGQMNDSKTNEGGWEACKMRTWLNGTFYNALPTALQAVISPCTKYTDNVGGIQLETNITATSDKIWIPSVFEYNGTGVLNRNIFNTYESNVQQQYEWFANGNGNTFDLFFKDFGISRIKYLNGTFSGNGCFWSRSPSHRNTTNFAEYSASYHNANAIDPIVPCFTIA